MADDIKIRVGVQNNVKAGMDNAVKSVNQSARQMAGGLGGAFKGILGGIGFMAVATGIRNLIRDVSDLKDAAAQVDFDPRNFQIVKAVAEDAGVGAEQLTAALGKLMKASSEVGSNKQMQNAFAALGISIDDVLSSNPEQLFQKIATGFAETGDKAAIFDLFGRGAQKLIPTLRELAGGFDAVANRGDIISNEDLNRLDAMDDKLNKIGRTLKSWGAAAVGNTVGFIEKVAARWGAISAGDTPEAGDRAMAAEDEAAKKRAEQAAEDKRIADEYAANKQREAYAIQEKIKAIEKENTAIKDQGEEAQNEALQREMQKQRLQDRAEAAGVRRDFIGRLAGRGDMDFRAAADRAAQIAIDPKEAKAERNAERQEERTRKRWGKLQEIAKEQLFSGRPLSPAAKRALDAAAKQDEAKQIEEDRKKLERDSAKAQIKAAILAQETADNTRKIKEMQEQLLTLK